MLVFYNRGPYLYVAYAYVSKTLIFPEYLTKEQEETVILFLSFGFYYMWFNETYWAEFDQNFSNLGRCKQLLYLGSLLFFEQLMVEGTRSFYLINHQFVEFLEDFTWEKFDQLFERIFQAFYLLKNQVEQNFVTLPMLWHQNVPKNCPEWIFLFSCIIKTMQNKSDFQFSLNCRFQLFFQLYRACGTTPTNSEIILFVQNLPDFNAQNLSVEEIHSMVINVQPGP